MKDIKINDAAYFPRPQAIYKELPINKTMGAQAGEYDDGKEWLHVSASRKSRGKLTCTIDL